MRISNSIVGDGLRLTKAMEWAAMQSEKYQSGTVTRIESWGTVDVQWNGIDHPTIVRSDEIEIA